ncbi:agmatinase [soil metagenome]
MPAEIIPVPTGSPSFIDAPRVSRLDELDADIAVIGVPYGVPYGVEGAKQRSSDATRTVREQSTRFARYLTHYDVDFEGQIFAGRDVRIVDCGDVAMEPGAYEENFQATVDVITAILDRGAVPIVLGGDHSIPIPVMRAYENHGPIFVVQLDEHFDWRDEVGGVRQGLSSTMRRASEMPWVSGMAQIGLRAVGSARQAEVDDAKDYSSILVTARELHRDGADAVLARIPDGARYYITFDADALDPTIAPGVGTPGFGGMTYYQATDLLRGIAAKGPVVGFDFVEVVPALDVNEMTSHLAARLTLNMIGAMAHAGQIGG